MFAPLVVESSSTWPSQTSSFSQKRKRQCVAAVQERQDDNDDNDDDDDEGPTVQTEDGVTYVAGPTGDDSALYSQTANEKYPHLSSIELAMKVAKDQAVSDAWHGQMLHAYMCVYVCVCVLNWHRQAHTDTQTHRHTGTQTHAHSQASLYSLS